MSRRRVLVMTWLIASAAPAALAVVLIGCCALPLHGLVHRLMPLCDIAEAALTAHHQDDGRHGDPSTPAPKQRDSQDGQRLVWKKETRGAFIAPVPPAQVAFAAAVIAGRSQVSPSAFRCDDDVGTRLARLDTLRI